MYLKRLELHGFKSFASLTAFDFTTGVTCIAGPNGAGKTNVADAIRWVLGEHASRVIRARKTEDIIFSGSEKRSQLGVAEVRITLDNADGWLPVDFEEVVVSRRAYRSGDNEYYLNQSRIRLKDVTDLFLKAQVGQNSYAFMGQGLVEQVLTLRPEERRGLLEEAADVRLHRDKLDEARRRLSATRDNLERVQLLVSEIEPRLRQLERQAGRAATHVQLSTELAQVLRALYGRQWQEAQESLAAARAACDQRQEEFDGAQRDLVACEEGQASLGSATEERRRDIAQRQEAYRSLEDYRRDLQRRITIDGEREDMIAARREELSAEMESLRRERDDMGRLLEDYEQRALALAEELAAVRAPEAEIQKLADLDARLGQLRAALVDAEAQTSRATTALATAEGRSGALTDQQARLQTELTSLEHNRSEQIAILKAWALEFADRRQRTLDLAPTVVRANRELNEAETRLSAASDALNRREEKVRTLDVETQSARVRLEAAQATDVELPAADAGVRSVLAAGGRVAGQEVPPDSRLHGVVGMVGQLLRVPAGLERAIEAALADSLHAVVAETQDDALAASELLVSEDLGRATIYPLNDIRQVHPVNLQEERGVLGVASELVRYDHRYRPLIEALLGRTIIVQNLGIGKLLLRRGLGSVVTLDGILLRPSGSISAGSAKPIRHAFVHQRDVGELPGELDRLEAAQVEAKNTLEAAKRELEDARQAQAARKPEAERIRSDAAKAEDTLRKHRARLSATAARLSALHARRHDVQEALADAERSLAAARGDLERARAGADGYEAGHQRLKQDIQELASAREALAHSTSEHSSRVAAIEAEQEGLQQQRRLQASSLARAEQELTRREELETRLAEELATVRGRLEAARRELEEKSKEAETVREELTPAQHALEQIESRQRTINEDLAAARSRAMEAERALLDAETGVRLRSDELGALRGRLEEEGFRPSDEGDVVPVDEGAGPPAWLIAEPAQGDVEIPPMRGGSQADPTALKERAGELRNAIRRLGPVNEQAETDFAESRERHEFLTTQLSDLSEAEESLQGAIGELEKIIKERFSTTFHRVTKEFGRYFETFFGGGHAELLLTKPDEHGLPGVDIIAQPPRKRVKTLNMLSGGERSLTAVALLFALLETNPSPICVLDEVDAALDEANVGRFKEALSQLAERTQFIIITHNRRTLEIANTIYGVSMGEDSASTVLSLRLSDIAES